MADGTSSTGAVHLNNGDTASGNTQIMNGASQTGNLNLGGANSVVINVNRPLTIGYTSAPSTVNMIGFQDQKSGSALAPVPATVGTLICYNSFWHALASAIRISVGVAIGKAGFAFRSSANTISLNALLAAPV